MEKYLKFIEQIGEGAFSKLYSAYDFRLNKQVALKIEKTINKNTLLQKEFEIYFVSTPKDITINFEGDNEWTTYYSSVNLGVPEGLKVYAVTGVKADKTVSLDTKEITFIPKNIGVLIQRTDKTKKEFTGMTMQSETKLEDVTPDEAHFLGTLAGIEDFTKIEGMKYVLKSDQFVQAVDGTLQANRCYILLTEKEAENVNVVDGDKDDIIVEQEGEANARAGEVLVSSVDGEGYKTIQVTPADVLYVTKNEITVLRYTGANGAFSRRVPGVNSNPVEVVPVDPTAAITCPCSTCCPAVTYNLLQCPYLVETALF